MADLTFDMALVRAGDVFAFEGAIPLEGVTAVMGPSGSGKSTFLMMLAGLEPQARGTIRFNDVVWAKGREALKPEDRQVGMVFQEGRLFPHLSVAENIAYGARRRGTAAPAVQGIVDGMGLAELMDRRPHTLSGGEARRVAVARALAAGPDVLFMDEPLSALDDEAKAQVLPYLSQAVAGSGIPVLYVTHAQSEVIQFADRVLRVENGQIAGWGEAPPTLYVTVIDAGPGQVLISLGDSEMVLDGYGQPGDARKIALPPDGLLISRHAPGPSGAAASVAAKVSALREDARGTILDLQVAGQMLSWRLAPGSVLAQTPPEPGQTVFLSILAATLR